MDISSGLLVKVLRPRGRFVLPLILELFPLLQCVMYGVRLVLGRSVHLIMMFD